MNSDMQPANLQIRPVGPQRRQGPARPLSALFSLLAFCALVSCSAAGQPDAAGAVPTEPCIGSVAAGETVQVVSTTGQIGDVLELIAGQRQIDETLWSVEALTRRSPWNPSDSQLVNARGSGMEPLTAVDANIQVQTLMGPGVDPHLYVPTLEDARALDGADVIFYNGLHLEAQMLKALKELSLTTCVVAVGDRVQEVTDLADLFVYSEEDIVDPHIWNSPVLWSAAAAVMAETLEEAIEGDQDALHENARIIGDRMLQARDILLDMFQPSNLRAGYLVTAHDAFGYFAQLTGLESVGLQGLSTESEVSAYDIQAIASLIVEERIPAMFVESSVSEDAVRAVQAAASARGWEVHLGGELYSDALGPAGSEGDTYLGMLQHNSLTIFNALSAQAE